MSLMSNPAALAHAHRVEGLNSLDRNALKIVAHCAAVQSVGCPIRESERHVDDGKALNPIW